MKKITERKFNNKLSLFDAVILVIGSTIGAGIFVLLSSSFRIAGSAVILAFVINSLIAFIIAGNYAEAASYNPIDGGGFSFVEEAYGEKARILGWIIWLGNASYASLCAIGFAKYISSILPINELIISGSVLFLFMIINLIGSKNVALFMKPLVISLLLLLVFVAIFIFSNPQDRVVNSDNLIPTSALSILHATSLLFVCFTGFEAITTISAEIKKPRRNIPKALFYSVGIVSIIYLLLVSAVVYSADINSLSGSEMVLIEVVKSSPLMMVIVFTCAAMAVLSAMNSALMAASRNVYALSRDKFLPDSLSDINPRFESPHKAIILTFIISFSLVLTNQVEFVASITNLSYMIIVSSVGLAVIRLRKFEDKESFKLPFHPLGSILCVILPLILIPFLELSSIVIGAVWTIIGFIIYRITKHRSMNHGGNKQEENKQEENKQEENKQEENKQEEIIMKNKIINK
jgi:amino acid transporter